MPQILLPQITDFEAHNKNTKEQYAALGQFVVAFEMMVNEARTCAMNLLDGNALSDIPFHHPVMTAKPIFEIFRALAVEYLTRLTLNVPIKERDGFNGVLAVIASEYFELASMRNTLLHGTWFVGWPRDEDPNSETFILSKFKPTKKGLEQEDVPKYAFELLALKDRCEDVRTWISSLHFCIPRKDAPHQPFSERFAFIDGKWQFRVAADMPFETLPRRSPEQS